LRIKVEGILAAEAAFDAVTKENISGSITLDKYEESIKKSWIWEELTEVRNVRPSFHNPLGLYGGVAYSGLDTLFFKGKTPWTFKHGPPDYASLKPANKCKQIEYPKADGIISFELLENVSRTGTYHEEDQPVHLQLKNGSIPQLTHNLPIYAGPEQKFCP